MTKCENCYHAEICKNYPNTGLPPKMRNELLDKGCEHFKDKSLIVELPCRVGDVLFTTEYDCDRNISYIEKVKCSSIEIDDVEISICCETIDDEYEHYVPEDFGESVFLSREEAERALAERELKENE